MKKESEVFRAVYPPAPAFVEILDVPEIRNSRDVEVRVLAGRALFVDDVIDAEAGRVLKVKAPHGTIRILEKFTRIIAYP